MSLSARGFGLLLAATLAALALSAGRAQAQDIGGTIVRDPGGDTVTYTFDLTGPPRGVSTLFFGISMSNYFFFDPSTPLNLRLGGCDWLNPGFQNLVICPPPINGFTFQLGQVPNEVFVMPNVPTLPGPNAIQGGTKKDDIHGGQSDEKIKTGKGNDNVDPGQGNDDVNTGAGNDRANTKDGEVDRLNGGTGKDVAAVDKKDKVKNVEVRK